MVMGGRARMTWVAEVAGGPRGAPAGGGICASRKAGGEPAADPDERGGGVAPVLGNSGEREPVGRSGYARPCV